MGQHANEQQGAAEQVHNELREEVGQRIDIAVNALDQFTGGMRLVKSHIQPETVSYQVSAQVVGRRPGHIFADIRGIDRDPLIRYGDDNKGHGGIGERLERPSAHVRVDKVTDQLRVQKLQANASNQQQRHQQRLAPLRPQIHHKHTGILFERKIHVYCPPGRELPRTER